jgi:hypothetical protein
MLGSFPPQTKLHEVTFPRHGWDEAPSGMLSRGTYTAKSTVSVLSPPLPSISSGFSEAEFPLSLSLVHR